MSAEQRGETQLSRFTVGAPSMPHTECTEIGLNTRCRDEHIELLGDVATFTVYTGSCSVQTYLTSHACRHIAAALLAAADRVEARIAPMQEAA